MLIPGSIKDMLYAASMQEVEQLNARQTMRLSSQQL